jgi:signal peptidase II
MKKMRWPWLLLTLLVVVVDYLSKQWVLAGLEEGEFLRVTSFANVHLVFNSGMAFGFLGNSAVWQVVLLSVLAVVTSTVLLVWFFAASTPSRLFLAALPLVVGGAIGNALERISHFKVTDFIDFHLFGWHFWTFNVADAAITVGIILLFLDWVLGESKQRS